MKPTTNTQYQYQSQSQTNNVYLNLQMLIQESNVADTAIESIINLLPNHQTYDNKDIPTYSIKPNKYKYKPDKFPSFVRSIISKTPL